MKKIIYLLLLSFIFVGCANTNLFQKRKYLPRFKAEKPIVSTKKDSLTIIETTAFNSENLVKTEKKTILTHVVEKSEKTIVKIAQKVEPKLIKKDKKQIVLIVDNKANENIKKDTVETYVNKAQAPPGKYSIVEKIIITGITLYFPYVSFYFIKKMEGESERYELAKLLLKIILIVLSAFILALFFGIGFWVLTLGLFDLERYLNIVGFIFASLILAYYLISAYLTIKTYWFADN